MLLTISMTGASVGNVCQWQLAEKVSAVLRSQIPTQRLKDTRAWLKKKNLSQFAQMKLSSKQQWLYSCMTMVQYRIFQRASNYFVFCYVFRPWFWHDFKQLVFTVHSVFQEHFVTRPTDSGQLGCWVHGKLGKKYRRPIPSCAVKEIRKAFPSESGEYKGFEYAHHDM